MYHPQTELPLHIYRWQQSRLRGDFDRADLKKRSDQAVARHRALQFAWKQIVKGVYPLPKRFRKRKLVTVIRKNGGASLTSIGYFTSGQLTFLGADYDGGDDGVVVWQKKKVEQWLRSNRLFVDGHAPEWVRDALNGKRNQKKKGRPVYQPSRHETNWIAAKKEARVCMKTGAECLAALEKRRK
jgi:hypothetical protein